MMSPIYKGVDVMPSNKPTYTLRIDTSILDNIRIFAEQDGRSLNKEIEYILKQYAIDRGMYGEDSLNIKKDKK